MHEGNEADDFPPVEELPPFDPDNPPRGTPLYQITEDDLKTLEDDLPKILQFNEMSCNNPVVRMRWRRVIEIIKNVRWNYGPPRNVSIHSVDDLGNPEGL